MMRKNVTSGETIDFGKIPKDCLSLLKERYTAYNDKPTSTLTDVDIAEDSEDEEDEEEEEIKSIGSDGNNDSSDSSSKSSSDSDSKHSHTNKKSKSQEATQASNQQNVINDKNVGDDKHPETISDGKSDQNNK